MPRRKKGLNGGKCQHKHSKKQRLPSTKSIVKLHEKHDPERMRITEKRQPATTGKLDYSLEITRFRKNQG
jgi:hypothetical protein